jgi:hypothetical protein
MSKWDIHIFNPRNQTTSTKRGVEVPGTESSMAYARAVIMWASAKYGKAQKYILAVPHRK